MSLQWITLIYLPVLVLLEWLYIRYAGAYLLDLPNHRSSHDRPTIRGGGFIFYFAVLGYFVQSGFAYPYFFGGLTLVAILGFLDDLNDLSRVIRLAGQATALGLLILSLEITVPWWGWLILFPVAAGVINAVNFMDGINGITAAYSLVALVTLWYINSFYIPFIDPQLLIVVFLSLLVFSWFNFRKKALCFAGDVGAVSIAFILLFALFRLVQSTGEYTFILFLGVYGVDTVGTILERLIKGKNIFAPHRAHLYQRMVNESRFSHASVSILYAFVQLLVNLTLVIAFNREWSLVLAGVVLLLVLIVAFAFVKIKVYKVFSYKTPFD